MIDSQVRSWVSICTTFPSSGSSSSSSSLVCVLGVVLALPCVGGCAGARAEYDGRTSARPSAIMVPYDIMESARHDVVDLGCWDLFYMAFTHFEGCNHFCCQREVFPSTYFGNKSNKTSLNPSKGRHSFAHFSEHQNGINMTVKNTRKLAPA